MLPAPERGAFTVRWLVAMPPSLYGFIKQSIAGIYTEVKRNVKLFFVILALSLAHGLLTLWQLSMPPAGWRGSAATRPPNTRRPRRWPRKWWNGWLSRRRTGKRRKRNWRNSSRRAKTCSASQGTADRFLSRSAKTERQRTGRSRRRFCVRFGLFRYGVIGVGWGKDTLSTGGGTAINCSSAKRSASMIRFSCASGSFEAVSAVSLRPS